jgi:hypothetical protein
MCHQEADRVNRRSGRTKMHVGDAGKVVILAESVLFSSLGGSQISWQFISQAAELARLAHATRARISRIMTTSESRSAA